MDLTLVALLALLIGGMTLAGCEGFNVLDEFEGIQYQRVKVQGVLASGEPVDAWTYEMKRKQR